MSNPTTPEPASSPAAAAPLGDLVPRCPRCDYDLAARRPGDPCSECGLVLPAGSVVLPAHVGSGPARWIGVVQGSFAFMQLAMLPGRIVDGEYGYAALHLGAAASFGWFFAIWWRDRRAAARGGSTAAVLVYPGGLAAFATGRERWRLEAAEIRSVGLAAMPYQAIMLQALPRPAARPGAGLVDRIVAWTRWRGRGASMLACRWDGEERREVSRVLAERLPGVPVRPAPVPRSSNPPSATNGA